MGGECRRMPGNWTCCSVPAGSPEKSGDPIPLRVIAASSISALIRSNSPEKQILRLPLRYWIVFFLISSHEWDPKKSWYTRVLEPLESPLLIGTGTVPLLKSAKKRVLENDTSRSRENPIRVFHRVSWDTDAWVITPIVIYNLKTGEQSISHCFFKYGQKVPVVPLFSWTGSTKNSWARK